MGAVRYSRFLLFVLAFLLLSVPFTPQKVTAISLNQAGGDQSCDQAQILVLIDHSGSMDRNDPTILRNYAPVHLLDVIARNYLLAKQSASLTMQPQMVDFAVIRFASSAAIGLDWTRIAPATPEDWTAQRQALEETLDLSWQAEFDLRQEIGNATNFERPFTLAEEMFRETQLPQDGCPERLILVLTDGKPDMTGEGMHGEELENHFDAVEQIVINSFREEGTDIFVTGINVSGDFYWQNSVRFWSQITQDSDDYEIPRAEKVATQADIGYRLTEIIRTTIGEGVTLIRPGELVVPPYVDKLILDFYKSDLADVMQLTDGRGLLTPDRSDVSVRILGEDDAIQTLEVTRPNPGIYQLSTTASTDDYRITQVVIYVTSQLTKPTANLQQFTTGEIQIRLVDGDGNVLPDYGSERYALQLDPTLSYQDVDVPISMAFDPKTSTLSGNITPMNPGSYTISVGAKALDDKNQEIEILSKETTQFTIMVEPVGLILGDPQSVQAVCPPTVNVPLRFPMSVVNTATNAPAKINLPVSWDISTENVLESKVLGPDENGNYALEVVPASEGDANIIISASAPDPVDATLVQFFEANKRISVSASNQYLLENITLGPQMNDIALRIDTALNRLRGETENRNVIVGRRFFFFPQKTVITADFINQETGLQGDFNYLPPATLINESTGGSIPSSGWRRDSAGDLVAEFGEIGFGNYQLMIAAMDTPCDVVLRVAPHVSVWRVSPGLSERVIVILVALIVIAAIGLGVFLGLCKWQNPLNGFLGITDQNGNWLFWKSINGRGCFVFKPAPPNRFGMVTKIKVNSLLLSKGEFRITVYILTDAKKNKIDKKKFFSNLNNWRSVALGNSYHIDWVRTQAEIRKS